MPEIHYPACTLNMRVRLDSSLRVDPLGAQMPGVNTSTVPRKTLPLVMAGADDGFSRTFGVVPVAASIELLSFREASKFSATVNFRDLPIDPRLLKGVAVTLLMGTVTAEDFADGMARAQNRFGARSSKLKLDSPGVAQEFHGIADKIVVRHTAEGSELQIEGRDLRSTLIDSPARPDLFADLDLTQGIDRVCLDILGKHPFMADRPVIRDDGFYDPVPSPADAGGLTRVLQGADGKARGRRNAKGDAGKMSFWDLIVQYCSLCGAVPYFRGKNLHLRPVRSLYQRLTAGHSERGNATPFEGGLPRNVGEAVPLSVRRLLYGRDVEEIEYSRTYTGSSKGQIVEVVCLNTSSAERGKQRLLQAIWPPDVIIESGKRPRATSAKGKKALASRVAPNNSVAATDVMRVAVSGITSIERLREVAHAIYEEVNHNEMGGSLRTGKLSSFGGSAQDPDLLRLQPGDTLELAVDAAPVASRTPLVADLISQARRSFEEEVDVLAKAIGDVNAARAIVATARGAIPDIQRFFYVSNVRLEWAADSGYEITCDFLNYVEPAHQFEGLSKPVELGMRSLSAGRR